MTSSRAGVSISTAGLVVYFLKPVAFFLSKQLHMQHWGKTHGLQRCCKDVLEAGINVYLLA